MRLGRGWKVVDVFRCGVLKEGVFDREGGRGWCSVCRGPCRGDGVRRWRTPRRRDPRTERRATRDGDAHES